MKGSEIVVGKRYVGRDGSVREVLERKADRFGCLIIEYVKVPGNTPRGCFLSTFAHWAVAVGSVPPNDDDNTAA